MLVEFEKWEANGNSFVLFRLGETHNSYLESSIARQASNLCQQHLGIGGDGVLVLRANGELLVYNSDGSLAANCGNGLRCAAASKFRLVDKTENHYVNLYLAEQEYTCNLLRQDKLGWAISCDFPSPEQLDVPETITTILDTWAYRKKITDKALVRIGNEHLVLILQECSEDPAEILKSIGPFLQEIVSGGINVHIAFESESHTVEENLIGRDLGDALTMHSWERGVGPTLACGSGAVAVGQVYLAQGLSERGQWLAIQSPGGLAYLRQLDADGPVHLLGRARLCFTGEVEL